MPIEHQNAPSNPIDLCRAEANNVQNIGFQNTLADLSWEPVMK